MPLGLSGSGLITGFDPTASGFGKVLQVVSATHDTEVSTTSTSYVTTNLTATITPSSASNKILVIAQMPCEQGGTIFSGVHIGLFRGTVAGIIISENLQFVSNVVNIGTITQTYLDAPATTSAQSYTVGLKTNSSYTTVKSCPVGYRANLVLIEVAA